MVVLKTKKELTPMLEACRISAQALQRAGEVIRPGITTAQIDHAIHDFIRSGRCAIVFRIWRLPRQRMHLGQR